MQVHSDQTEFCVSYDFLIASSRGSIVKAPLGMWTIIYKFTPYPNDIRGKVRLGMSGWAESM